VVSRLRARGAERDLAKLADPSSFLAALDHAAPAGPHLVVNAEATPVDIAQEILAAVATTPG
jgi:hypothetical protein